MEIINSSFKVINLILAWTHAFLEIEIFLKLVSEFNMLPIEYHFTKN